MATASEILTAIAPQFDDVAGRQVALDLAESRTSSTHFGATRSEAVALRAAHNLALDTSSSREDGSAGPITSKSEGDLSISFGSSAQGSGYMDPDLSQTMFGRRLIGLLRSRPASRTTGSTFILSGGAVSGGAPWR